MALSLLTFFFRFLEAGRFPRLKQSFLLSGPFFRTSLSEISSFLPPPQDTLPRFFFGWYLFFFLRKHPPPPSYFSPAQAFAVPPLPTYSLFLGASSFLFLMTDRFESFSPLIPPLLSFSGSFPVTTFCDWVPPPPTVHDLCDGVRIPAALFVPMTDPFPPFFQDQKAASPNPPFPLFPSPVNPVSPFNWGGLSGKVATPYPFPPPPTTPPSQPSSGQTPFFRLVSHPGPGELDSFVPLLLPDYVLCYAAPFPFLRTAILV